MTAASQARLLLVLEEDDLREALSAFLREDGYPVEAVSSVEDALNVLESSSFQLILSDFFRLRDPVAFHSVERLRQAAHPTPVGILTASTLAAEEVTQRGFACLIPKPFELDDLSATIAACLHPR